MMFILLTNVWKDERLREEEKVVERKVEA